VTEPDGAKPSGPISPDLEGLRRLERRIARSVNLRAMGRRLWLSVPAILQIVVAAVVSYAIAHFGLGHATPVLAVTVVITSLGFTRDARPIRVLRSVFGIVLGIAVATALGVLIGSGWWQLTIVLVVAMAVARLLVADPALAVAAATPAALTVLLPVPEYGVWLRALDGLIGGVVALVVTVLLPRDPRRTADRDRRAVYSVLAQAMENLVDCLRDGDAGAGELGLTRLRRMDELLAAWRQSLDTARSVARLSPFLRPRLPELDRAARALQGADYAARHLRLIARRAEYLAREGGRREALAGLVEQIGRAMALISAELDDLGLAGAARSLLEDIAPRLDPGRAVPDASASESAIVVQLRPLVVDLLVATGLPLGDARGRLPPI